MNYIYLISSDFGQMHKVSSTPVLIMVSKIILCGELSRLQFILINPESDLEFTIVKGYEGPVGFSSFYLLVVSETLCHLLLLLHPTVTFAWKSLDKTDVFRAQHLVVTSTVSGEINNHDVQLQPLISPSDTIFYKLYCSNQFMSLVPHRL